MHAIVQSYANILSLTNRKSNRNSY